MKNRIIAPSCLCLGILLFGISGYMLIEDYSLLDALYMTVITITTVGFGEIVSLSGAGRLFTIILILIGFSSLAYAGHAVAETFLERIWSGKNRSRKMQNYIDKLEDHYIICGFGRVGEASAAHFLATDAPFVILEQNAEICQQISEGEYLFVEGDASREVSLMAAGIKKARGVLALLNSDPLNLFVVLTARELNPTLRIIARCAESSAERKIIRAGADSVISPYTTAGKHFAESMLASVGNVQASGLDNGVALEPQWIKVMSGSAMEGKALAEISDDMDRDIIGLRRHEQDFLIPEGTMVIQVDDELLVMDVAVEDEEDEVLAHPPKVVIIDDNPVIVRLYARLFHKAGFDPLTAFNGEDGLDMILEHDPEAAVIDYKLPCMSGIDLCEKVRQALPGNDIKLIIFTADELPETKEKAMLAGANRIIIKSAESAELIDEVVQMLRN